MAELSSSRLPLYVRVEEALLARISSGAIPVGAQLPSEEELIQEFGVSRTTIRTTIQNLVLRGLIEIRRGRGTFVRSPGLVQELTGLTGFVEDMRLLGRAASARVIAKDIISAPADVAAKLALSPGAPIVQIRRVRLADGTPLSYDETYLPEELGRKVMADDLANQPIFTLLEQRYDTPLIEADYVMEAAAADAAIAAALEIKNGAPVFVIERTSFTTGQLPIDYERLHYRGDQIRFKTRLTRPAASQSGG